MTTDNADLRRWCRGFTPLDARLCTWQTNVLREPERLRKLIDSYGSPIHLLSTEPFRANGLELLDVAALHGVDLSLYFARKANKCLSFVDAARLLGWGVDVSGLEEVDQALFAGIEVDRLFITAAVKPRRLLAKIVEHRIPTALDNRHEVLDLAWAAAAADIEEPIPVAVRLSGFIHDGRKLYSRFGFDIDDARERIAELWSHPLVAQHLKLSGLHFHLDGYDPTQRVSALHQSIAVADRVRDDVGSIDFVDMGGGLPVRYLESDDQWRRFWSELRRALVGDRAPITYRNDGLGLHVANGDVVGVPNTYPFAQSLDAPAWLDVVLASPLPRREEGTVAEALSARGLELRCEPGRSLLDGCGMTVARVVWTKDHPAGHRIAALEMNRTQCRTSSADFLVDPLVVPAGQRPRDPDPVPTYLTGAYCTETSALCMRALRMSRGLAPGDLVVWPNTAGYFMHFLESRSHQFPLARNLVLDVAKDAFALDPIDWIHGSLSPSTRADRPADRPSDRPAPRP